LVGSAVPGELEHSTTNEPGGLWSRRGRHPRRFEGVEYSAPVFELADGRWGCEDCPPTMIRPMSSLSS